MEGKVLLQDLAQSLANKRKMQRKDAEIFLKAFFETISNGILQDKIVKIKGLGTFKMIEVQDRESVNVNTGERIVIPGHSKISFTPDAELKDMVNKPFALFQTVIINEGTSLEDMEKMDGVNASDESIEPTDVSPEEGIEEPVVLTEPEVPVEQERQEEPSVSEKSEMQEKQAETPKEPAESLEEPDETPKKPDESQPLPVSSQQPPVNEAKWWRISPAMTALLFAFFWIVLLVGYFTGKNNWFNLDQIINKPSQETVVKVDTIYVEKLVEPDSVYMQEIKDSLRNVILEETKTKKVQPTVPVPQVAKPDPKPMPQAAKPDSKPVPQVAKPEPKPVTQVAKPVVKPVTANKQNPVAYEIVGQKGVRTIKAGDYLLKIIREEYGSDNVLKYVISYNNFTNPNNLPIGTEVKLPILKEK